MTSTRIRRIAFLALGAVYLALIVAVVVGSPLDAADQWVQRLDLMHRWPDLNRWVSWFVMIGQRGPAILAALPVIGWLCWRRRSWLPAITVGVALALLNLSVGVIKLSTGRLGPRVTSVAHAVFEGGDIFPSGHASNSVVLFGVLAVLATRHRRAVATAAVTVSLLVGLCTMYLDTHWATDVVGGWLAGALVLLALSPRSAR